MYGAATLQVTNLSFQRQSQRIIKQLSLQLASGHALQIMGANGVGKSTLLRLIAGFITPQQGEINFNSQNIQTQKLQYWEHLHFLGHQNGNKLGLTVLENIMLTAHLAQQNILHVNKELEALQLTKKINAPVFNLSAGQKKRVALAKLFLIPRSLWILDEPLAALDNAMQTYFLMKLEEHLQKGGLAIISTHQKIVLSTQTLQTLLLSSC